MVIFTAIMSFFKMILGVFIDLKKNDKPVEETSKEVGNREKPSVESLEDRINRGPGGQP